MDWTTGLTFDLPGHIENAQQAARARDEDIMDARVKRVRVSVSVLLEITHI